MSAGTRGRGASPGRGGAARRGGALERASGVVDEDRVEEALTAQLHPIFAAMAAGGRGRVLRKGATETARMS